MARLRPIPNVASPKTAARRFFKDWKKIEMERNKPRILIIGAQHGDERLGPQLYRFLKKDPRRYASVDYLCGNPKAYRQGVRFIESDLNRSFVPNPKTYEQKRAQKILTIIAAGKYDYVLDIHTAREEVGRLFIATRLDDTMERIIAASRIERVAIMPPKIANCSLIGNVPNAISVEYERQLAGKRQTLRELKELIDNLLYSQTARPREIFYVEGAIPLTSEVNKRAKNFELCEEKFYPVIFGPGNTAYTEHKGFAARKKELQII
jgi:hypothetical protein